MAFTRAELRSINVQGWAFGLTGNDPVNIVNIADPDWDIETFVAAGETLGYEPVTVERFALALLSSGVLFSDAPPAEESEPEEMPGLSTDTPNFADTLEAELE